MRSLFLLVVFGLGTTVQAQETCPMSLERAGTSDPSYVTPDVSLFPASEVNVTRTIPVFFHVVQGSTNTTSLDIPRLQQQVDLLNWRFATPPRQPGGPDWTVPRYRFTLAGADRVVNDAWAAGVNYDLPDSTGEYAMKELLAVDPARVLNVYVVRTLKNAEIQDVPGEPQPPPYDIRGYALFPFPFEYGGERGRFPVDTLPERQFSSRWGILIHPDYFPGGAANTDGTTLVHEVGHQLGLIHTEDGGCAVAASDCRLSGDFVCDTPPTRSWPSCNGRPMCGQVEPLGDNVMYSTSTNECRTMFTNATPAVPPTPDLVGQVWRTAMMGAVYKPALGEPGVLPTMPSVQASRQTGTSYTTVVERRVLGGTWQTSPADLVVGAPLVVASGVEVRVAPG
ncbi:MAG TPA: M43 family zinc metalloprotease, partial [Rubricoccaceae bacterium]